MSLYIILYQKVDGKLYPSLLFSIYPNGRIRLLVLNENRYISAFEELDTVPGVS